MIAASERALVGLVMIALVGVAHAQPAPTAADEAFRQGRELFKDGKFAEACAEFEKSQKLDPQLGTLFNIASCSAKIGKLATAAAAYRELVARDTNETRKETSERELAQITPRIPRLVIKMPKPPAGLTLSLDNKDGSKSLVANEATEVDLGDYQLVAKARGYQESIRKVKISAEAKETSLDVELDPLTGGDDDGPPRSKRKLVAIGLTATGGAVLIGGIVVGVLARSAWNDAKAVCGGTTCTSSADVDRANVLADKARGRATLSTVLTLGGVLIAGAGVALWVTTPAGDVQIAPTASDDGAGVTLLGSF